MTLIDIKARFLRGEIDRNKAIETIRTNFAITRIGAEVLVERWNGNDPD